MCVSSPKRTVADDDDDEEDEDEEDEDDEEDGDSCGTGDADTDDDSWSPVTVRTRRLPLLLTAIKSPPVPPKVSGALAFRARGVVVPRRALTSPAEGQCQNGQTRDRNNAI